MVGVGPGRRKVYRAVTRRYFPGLQLQVFALLVFCSELGNLFPTAILDFSHRADEFALLNLILLGLERLEPAL